MPPFETKILFKMFILYRNKKMKYRSRDEIISQILDAANGGGGATKTELMYKAYLSMTK